MTTTTTAIKTAPTLARSSSAADDRLVRVVTVRSEGENNAVAVVVVLIIVWVIVLIVVVPNRRRIDRYRRFSQSFGKERICFASILLSFVLESVFFVPFVLTCERRRISSRRLVHHSVTLIDNKIIAYRMLSYTTARIKQDNKNRVKD